MAAHHREGSGLRRIGYPIGVRRVPVLARAAVTPRMVRLTLGGEALEGFHSYQADDHVKIVFSDPDGTQRDPVANADLELDWPRPLPTTRKYTVRRFDADTRELDLDFVLHEGGVASTWVKDVAVGDEVTVAGPPGAKAFAHTYEHYVLAVDATALPAAARWIEEAPDDVSAQLVVETNDACEHAYPVVARPGVDVTWIARADRRSCLARTVQELVPPSGRTFLFAAGEAEDIRPLRAWSRGRIDSLITGYWKRGVPGLEE